MARMVHAWRSKKSGEINGFAIYKNRHGHKVEISVVVDGPKKHRCKWPDMQYIGLVRHPHAGGFIGRVPPTTEEGRIQEERQKAWDRKIDMMEEFDPVPHRRINA